MRVLVDHAHARQDLAAWPEDRVASPRPYFHRRNGGVITDARVLGGVVHDEPIAQADEEVAEALPDGVLASPGLLEVDANAGLPERAVLVDQRDKGPLASGYRGSQVGQVVKLLFRLGIEEPGSQHGRDPPAIR